MKKIKKALDTVTDALEKVHTPASRAGNGIERAAKMFRAGVAPKAIAEQMSANSRTGVKYTPKHVAFLAEFYKDSETRPLLTASQTRTLLENQEKQDRSKGTSAKRIVPPIKSS